MDDNEIDRTVAEKVMGWKQVTEHFWADPSPLGQVLGLRQVPAYSKDIAAAWEVVGKLAGDGCWVTVEAYRAGARVTVERPGTKMREPEITALEEAPTAQKAICLAALRHVGAISQAPEGDER